MLEIPDSKESGGERTPFQAMMHLHGSRSGAGAARRAGQSGRPGCAEQYPLQKPFAPAQLVTAVSQLLNTGAPQAAPIAFANQ